LAPIVDGFVEAVFGISSTVCAIWTSLKGRKRNLGQAEDKAVSRRLFALHYDDESSYRPLQATPYIFFLVVFPALGFGSVNEREKAPAPVETLNSAIRETAPLAPARSVSEGIRARDGE
jgi:hypothetical protein